MERYRPAVSWLRQQLAWFEYDEAVPPTTFYIELPFFPATRRRPRHERSAPSERGGPPGRCVRPTPARKRGGSDPHPQNQQLGKQMILVIGATGNVGRHVLSQLHAIDAADVRALVRPGKAAHLPDGVDVATGSLDDPDGMTAALTGVKTVFLVWPFLTTEGAPAALEAIGQHAQRLVYLSSIGVGGRPEEQGRPHLQTAR